MSNSDTYNSYAELARRYVRGQDYEISVCYRANSPVAIIAPHGGKIENRTSEIARSIAGEEFNLYLFEGRMNNRNYHSLHLTSHNFDEPECLRLIGLCPIVVAVHGCRGATEEILLGGRDADLKRQFHKDLLSDEVAVRSEGHNYPARRPDNICNRGMRRKGVQFELTTKFRGSESEVKAILSIRKTLMEAISAI